MKKCFLFFIILHASFYLEAQQITFEKKYDYSYHAEGGSDLVQTSDGGYMIAGGQGITFGYINMLTLRTDSLGNELLTQFFGNGGEWTTIEILQLSDSVFYTAGNSNVFNSPPSDRDFLLAKTDGNGDTMWTRTYGNIYDAEQVRDIKRTLDGNLILAGFRGSNSPDPDPAYFVKVDQNGDTLWSTTWGTYFTPSLSGAMAIAITPTFDSGYAATGFTFDSLNRDVMFLLKMNSAGTVQWYKLYGHDSIGSVEGYDILQLPDSGFILIGNKSIYDSTAFLNIWHSYLVRTNSNGDTIWTKSIVSGSHEDYFYKAAMVSPTEFVVTGTTLNSPNVTFPYGVDITLQKFNINGDLLWSRLYGDTSEDNSYSVIQTLDGGFAIIGYTYGSCQGCVYLIKTDSLGCVVPGCQFTGIEETQFSEDDFKIFPNPASSVLNIQSVNTPVEDLKIHIYDALGRNAESSINQIGSKRNELSLNVKNGLNGFYFLKIQNKKTGKYYVKKIIIIN